MDVKRKKLEVADERSIAGGAKLEHGLSESVGRTNETPGRKKIQKTPSLSDSSQRERSVLAELKDRETRLSFLNVFKFHRRKSVKELTQDSDSDNGADGKFSHPPEKPVNPGAELGESTRIQQQQQELFLDAGIERGAEVGALSEMTNDNQKKGRFQHLRTRLQQRMALPNKPDVNLSLDLILAKKKSIQRKRITDSANLKVQLPSGMNRDYSACSSPSPRSVDNSQMAFWPQKSPSQSSSIPASVGSFEDSASRMNSSTARQMQAESYLTAAPLDIKPRHMERVRADRGGGPLSVAKGHRRTPSSEFTVVDNVSTRVPASSIHPKDFRKSDGIILEQKLRKNKNAFQTFIERRRVLRSSTEPSEDTGEEDRISSQRLNLKPRMTRHSSHLKIFDPDEFIERSEVGNPHKSQNEQNLFSGDCSFARIQKKASSLPDLLNVGDNVFELADYNGNEIANDLSVDSKVTQSKLCDDQSSVKTESEKQKRFLLTTFRDRSDLNQSGLKNYNQNDIRRNENLSTDTKQILAPPSEYSGILRRQIKSGTGERLLLASAVMFARKSHGDVKKSAQKVLDPRKDLVTRLKHLRVVLESFDVAETKAYFEQYFSVLYFLFHESFSNVEANLGQRVSKGHREELDFALLVLEKILVLLPDLIHKRWQLNSIGRIMKRLLHSGNSPKLRRDGMRLFVIWYEILMDNATEDCHKLFKSLIPQMSRSTSFYNFDAEFLQSKVIVPDITSPLLPSQPGEVQPEEPCSWLLDCLLADMVSEVSKIWWNNSETHRYCLKFLFDKFKEFYLPVIFPELVWNASVYEPCLDLPDRILLSNEYTKTSAFCQESVIKWISKYTLIPNVVNQSAIAPRDSSGVVAASEPRNPGSNASTVSIGGGSWADDLSSGSNAGKTDESLLNREIVRSVFYSSRENINIIHEVLRQAFLCPFQTHRGSMVRRVINIYRSWFLNDEKPIFMQEPKLCRGLSCSEYPSKRQSATSAMSGESELLGSSTTSEDVNLKTDVRAGLQRVLQVFIRNSSNVFLFEKSSAKNDSLDQRIILEDQVDVCKKVLKMYRYLVMDIILDKTSWEQLLTILLKITSTVMMTVREKSLADRMAEPLFKTLMLSWVKANLSILVSQQLWRNLIEMLSSLTNCIHLIQQWSKTMELLTRILAQCIYDIDLRDLPLDKLSKRKANRLTGTKNADHGEKKESSLTKNWVKQILDGAYSTKQKWMLLAAEATAAAAAKIGGSHRDVCTVSEFHLNSAAGDQPFHNKVSQPKYHSQFDLSSDNFSLNADSSNILRLPRSSSDSDILIDSRRPKVARTVASDSPERIDVRPNLMERTDDVFCVDEEETDSRNHAQSSTLNQLRQFTNRERTVSLSETPKLRRSKGEFTGESCSSYSSAHPRQSVADSASITSNDSSVLPYSAMVNHSRTSSSSFNIERNSCSDHSDTEALMRMSDSGSASSHGLYLRSQFSSSRSNEVKLTEEDEENDDSDEARVENRNRDVAAAELSSIKVANESLDDGDSLTVRDLERNLVERKRDSLQIEDDEAFMDLCNGVSQMPSSCEPVWTPDVTVLLWQRMLGCLGNVNDIKNPEMHARVFEFLSDLLNLFIKIRENQGVTKDNQTTPTEPIFVPPILLLSAWCFEALKLPDDYRQGKLLAYQILCTSTVRRHDIELPPDHLQRFYLVLHHGLVHSSQEVTNVLIRYCNSNFFSRSLPGSTLLVLDFIRGAESVLSQPFDAKNVPRAEAMSVLGSLLCFQKLLQEIPVLDPDSKEFTVVKCEDVKDLIFELLLKFTRKEPRGRSRCIAISALGLYMYEDLCRPETLHPRLKEAFDILLSVLMLTDRAASLTATHVLTLLSDHLPLLLLKLPHLPCAVIQDMTKAVAHLLPAAQSNSSIEAKKVISQILISVMFVLLEWCMRIPRLLLINHRDQNGRSLLLLVIDALNLVVNGGRRAIPDSCEEKITRLSFPDSNRLSNGGVPFTPAAVNGVDRETSFSPRKQEKLKDESSFSSSEKMISDIDDLNSSDSYGVKCAARTVIFHLINFFNHFPMSTDGAAQMSSDVEESHDTDLEEVEPSNLSAHVLASNNTQFFVINNTTLISFVEIPMQKMDQNKAMNGLTTEKTVCRIISRDPSGKHCWDSSILYGNQLRQSVTCSPDSPVLLCIKEEEQEVEFESKEEIPPSLLTDALQSPASSSNDEDVLDIMLQYLSESSPECLLRSGEALNSSFHIPVQLIDASVEEMMQESMIRQRIEEKRNLDLSASHGRMASKKMKPLEHHGDPLSPFQFCRLFLDQLGFIANEKRKTFDLLHKSEKLFRELKHLDNQRCRDTHKIAVIYVGPRQEDKVSILRNAAGSNSFNEFVTGLGWQVNLQSHSGFMGGLQRNQATGLTAPYYCTSTTEVMFHVSTQMPSETEEDQLRKLKHLGNDEVHIIWSEHKRDYRHGIIPTEFGDVLIVIYPLENGLFRIQIIQRSEVSNFGPLFDGAIVNFQVLAGLTRATAISAGQMLRSVRPHYQPFYAERMRCIDNIVKNYKMMTTFEVFSSQIFAPSPQLDAENSSYANLSSMKSQMPPIIKTSKEENAAAVHRKLSLAAGKPKKLKKMQSMQSASTPPHLPNFDIRQIR